MTAFVTHCSRRCRTTAQRRRWRGASGGRMWPVRRWSRCATVICWTYRRASRPCATCARPMRPPIGCAPRPASASAGWTMCWPTRRPTVAIASRPWLLAPIDLQAIKAAGVTFVLSMIERVIEERARGDLIGRGGHPRGGEPAGRRRSGEAEAWLGGGGASEAGADRAGRVEPVPGGRHRPGCGDLHQGAADGRGRHRHGCGHSSELVVEQSGARGGAGRVIGGPHRRRDAWATT